jgi:hypothetical protein
MSTERIGVAVLALVALLVGGVWLSGAIGTRRRRTEIAATYSSSGGPVFTFVQFGCAGVLMLLGVAILAADLVARR